MTDSDPLVDALDEIADAKLDPATFPGDAPVEFRRPAVLFLDEVRALRQLAEGADPREIWADGGGFVVDPDEVKDWIAYFHERRDHRRYAACCAVYDWMTAA